MKILGIVAGRHNGNSEILVKEALLACQEAGAECKLINLFDYNIEHCTGCEACTMQMGDVAMGKLDKYNGCILKSKDDMDKIVQEMYTCNGIIVGVPTYDLTPSSLYLKFAQRFLAYELPAMTGRHLPWKAWARPCSHSLYRLLTRCCPQEMVVRVTYYCATSRLSVLTRWAKTLLKQSTLR